ncbi:2'-5' RNA ligase family protein [Nonomuraea harbinensis]|uniref:2'-5' RNA ligase family protein n=1 Tax=Nonomuraea harbinensis TaxID=1286938 RepID=A0ABW1C5V0_9ACTN|nr:2'-5' RNA ligase family protein [Nonomuraea harbinensis]
MTEEPMADHWWWRPGWRQGRRFYTWHLTFDHAHDVHRLARRYRDGLARVKGLDLVPDRWLHLTMQGLGFVDELAEVDVRAIVDAARARLATVPPFTITLDRPRITPEAIRWEAHPQQPVVAVRNAIRDAIASVWPAVPEPAEAFAGHVTIAYSNAQRPPQPVADALDTVQAVPALTLVRKAELIVLGRDRRMYEWEEYATAPLGG